MCGLCGVISNVLSKGEIENFQDLMVVSTLRGTYGAGVAAVPVNTAKKVEIIRSEALTAAELAYGPELQNTIKDAKPFSIMMGHARNPTTGGYDLEDTHPHVHGKIIGMHNGTFKVVHGTRITDKLNDSRELFKAVDIHGIDNTVQKSVGAYTVAYLDTQEGTLNFLRNAARPLFWARVANQNTVYWASEDGMLNLVLRRAYPGQNIQIYVAQPDRLVRFRIRPLSKVEPFDSRIVKRTLASVPIVPASSAQSMPDNDQYYETTPNNWVSYGDLRMMLANGCAYCTQGVTEHEYQTKRLHWTKADEFVCDDCAQHDPIARAYVRSFGLLLDS